MEPIYVKYSKNPSLDQYSIFFGCHFSDITFSNLHLDEKTIQECVFREITFQNCRFTSTLCRADKAIVLGFYNKKGEPLNLTYARSIYDGNFIYTRGEAVHADSERKTCAPGIHFFLTFQEAVDYIQ